MPKFAHIASVFTRHITDADMRSRRISAPLLDCCLRPVPVGSSVLLSSGDLARLEVGDAVAEVVSVGVYMNPDEYVKLAMTKSYPGDSADYLPADIRECIEFLAKSSPKEVMAHRLKQVVFVKRLVRDCADEQQALESSLHPSVKRVMQGKQIVAICKLLKLMNLDDP
eukprot:3172399-Amphidinium_carterae.1